MVAFGPQSLACGIESAGVGGVNAVTLCQHRDMKTPGQLPGRAFPLTVTGDKVRQIDFGSPTRTRTKGMLGKVGPLGRRVGRRVGRTWREPSAAGGRDGSCQPSGPGRSGRKTWLPGEDSNPGNLGGKPKGCSGHIRAIMTYVKVEVNLNGDACTAARRGLYSGRHSRGETRR